MPYLALSGSFEYLCYGSMAFINIFTFSTLDVYRCQILMSEVSPHAERVNPFNPELIIVIFIHYKPRIAVAIVVDEDDLKWVEKYRKFSMYW